MEIYKTQSPIAAKTNWFLSLFVLVLISFGIMIVLQGIALVISIPLFNIGFSDVEALVSGNLDHPNGRMALLFIQGIGSGLAFWVAALVVAKFVDKANFGWQQQLNRFKFSGLLYAILILMGTMLFNSLLISWNASLELPEALSELERYMRTKEDELMELTKYFTDFQNLSEFLLGFLVIGILAGIGEEVLFRGVLQPKLQYYFGNPHAGIWVAAFVFSAIHFQFYGLFPRMLLGAVFGYLYHYSGSLTYPIIAHILNNGITVVLIYLDKLGKLDFDMEDTEQVAWPYALLGLVLLVFAFKIFRDKHFNKPA
jgi:uncharacterized protein